MCFLPVSSEPLFVFCLLLFQHQNLSLVMSSCWNSVGGSNLIKSQTRNSVCFQLGALQHPAARGRKHFFKWRRRYQQESKTKKKKVNSKKYCGTFKYKVLFQCEWKVNFLVKGVYKDKYKFYCLPCIENISCYHQCLGDLRVHYSTSTHKIKVT